MKHHPTPTIAGVAAGMLACSLAHALQPAAAASSDVAHAPIIDSAAPTCRPEYPLAALQVLAMGTTTLKFTVDARGHLVNAEIVGSAGPTLQHRLLDVAARDALSNCSFRPAVDAAGQSVGGTITVQYVWHLD